MRFIEFAVATEINSFEPSILLIDCNDISSFNKTEHHNICKLNTKTNQTYLIYGTYKTITNRFFYALSKKHNIYEDDIIRPSIRVIHRPNSLETDVAFFDLEQLKAFIYSIDSNYPIEKLPQYTQDLLLKKVEA